MQMPYATAYDLLTTVHKVNEAAAEQAADLIEQIVPPHASPDEADPMLALVKDFATLHANHPEVAFKLLWQAVKNSQTV